MTDLDKKLAELFRPMLIAKAEEVRSECKACHGTGNIADMDYAFDKRGTEVEIDKLLISCPECTERYNEIMDMADLVCWQEHSLSINNPKFSIEPLDGYASIVEVMKLLGLWEGFVLNVFKHIQDITREYNYRNGGNRPLFDEDLLEMYAGILTNKTLLSQAIVSYLEGLK